MWATRSLPRAGRAGLRTVLQVIGGLGRGAVSETELSASIKRSRFQGRERRGVTGASNPPGLRVGAQVWRRRKQAKAAVGRVRRMGE